MDANIPATPEIDVKAWRSGAQAATASHFIKVSQLASQALESLDYPSITRSLDPDKDALGAFARLGRRMAAEGLLIAPAAEALGFMVAKGLADLQIKDYQLVSAWRGLGVDSEFDHEVPFPGGAASWSVSAEAKSAFAKGMSSGSGVDLGFGLVAPRAPASKP